MFSLYLARKPLEKWLMRQFERYFAKFLKNVQEHPEAMAEVLAPVIQYLIKSMAKGGNNPGPAGIKLPFVGKVPISELVTLYRTFTGKGGQNEAQSENTFG